MKVYINPTFDKEDSGEGGIRQVVTAQLKYLPEYGVEFTNDPEQADVVNCHATSVVGHPNLVLSCHGLYWDEDKWEARWIADANRMVVDGMRRAKVVTAPSEWVANVLRRGMLLDPVVVNHGIDPDAWSVGENYGYVLWNKNRHDPSCDSAVVNRLAMLAPSISFTTTYGTQEDNVRVVGRMPHEDMKLLIQGAGVYLATAKETFGVGILEAMACGVPVLGWDWGGQAEIVNHKYSGYLAKPNDYDDLLEGLHYCLENRDSLGTHARNIVYENYLWEHVIGGYYIAYQRALKSNPLKVSVIITAYNLAEYLPSAVQSVLEQTYSDWELIIVNDCSTDNTAAVAEELAKQDARISVIHNPENVHVSESRNIGIRASKGEYIICLDADDRLNTKSLELLSRALDRDRSVSIACGAMQVHYPDGRTFVSGWPPPEPCYENQIIKQNQLPYASLYRRSVWERTGGYRRRIHTGVEDADFWTRAFSYGFRAMNISNYPTLLYTMREDSLSHVKKGSDFLSWYSWSKHPELAPFAALETIHVRSINPTKITVVIPVGEGHDIYLQDCLDSLLSQTFEEWEVIIVNDTGESWYKDGELINPYLQGFSFARIIDSDENHGTAYARNTGIRWAKSDLIAFLDADDYVQPQWLETLYKVYKQVGGWIYCDWYADNGQELYHDKAQDWSAENLLNKAVGPITGLYEKKHLLQVGGFDENIQGWEDWDLHLSLLEQGICGTRVAHPLFTYRYRTGINRDKDFANKNDLLKYIEGKHNKLYKERNAMCSSCGGAPTVNMRTGNVPKKSMPKEDFIFIKYIGDRQEQFRVKSQVILGDWIIFRRNEPTQVLKAEAYRFLDGRVDFVEIKEEPPKAPEIKEEKPIVVETTVKPSAIPLHKLDLEREVITILKDNGYKTAQQIKLTSDASLLTIKGLGERRIAKIREAVNAVI